MKKAVPVRTYAQWDSARPVLKLSGKEQIDGRIVNRYDPAAPFRRVADDSFYLTQIIQGGKIPKPAPIV